MKFCHRFHPSQELLSCLLQGLLSTLGPDVHQQKILEHMSPERNSI